jgi:hypothetical protein
VNGFAFMWREVGPWEALRFYWWAYACRLLGHRWERHTWFESWDKGVGIRMDWWSCRRCEKYSAERPA